MDNNQALATGDDDGPHNTELDFRREQSHIQENEEIILIDLGASGNRPLEDEHTENENGGDKKEGAELRFKGTKRLLDDDESDEDQDMGSVEGDEQALPAQTNYSAKVQLVENYVTRKKLVEARKKVKDLEEQVSDLENLVEERDTDLLEAEDSYSVLQQEYKELLIELTEVDKKFQEYIDKHLNQEDQLRTKVETLKTNLSEHQVLCNEYQVLLQGSGKLSESNKGLQDMVHSRFWVVDSKIKRRLLKLERNKKDHEETLHNLQTEDLKRAEELRNVQSQYRQANAELEAAKKTWDECKQRDDQTIQDLRLQLAAIQSSGSEDNTASSAVFEQLRAKAIEIESKESQMATLKRDLDECKAQIVKFKHTEGQEMESLRTKLQQQTESINALKESYSKRVEDLETTTQELETEIATVQEELKGKTEALATAKSASQMQIAELDAKLRKAEVEKSELLSLQVMRDELQKKLSDLRKEHTKVAGENEHLKLSAASQVDSEEVRLKALQDDYNNISAKLTSSKEALAAAESKRDDALHSGEVLKAQKNALDIEFSELRLSKQRKDEEACTLQHEITRLQEQLETTEAGRFNCSVGINRPIRTQPANAQDLANANHERDEARGELRAMRTQKDTLDDTVKELHATVKNKEEEIKRLKDTIRTLQKDSADAQKARHFARKGRERPHSSSTSDEEGEDGQNSGQQANSSTSRRSPETSSEPQPNGPSRTGPEVASNLFIATRKTRRNLKLDARMEMAAAHSSRPQYGLGPEIETPPAPSTSPWYRPWENTKGSKYVKESNRDRGTDKNRSVTGDDAYVSDTDDEGERDIENLRNGPESDRSLVYEKYMNLPFQSRTVSQADARKEINKVARSCIQEATNAEYSMEIFGKPGVSAERLAQFKENPASFGPKIHNSFIDKRGDTRAGYKMSLEFRKSKWNQEMVHNVANLCASIARDCPDKGRFGAKRMSVQWHQLVGDRFRAIYVDIVNSLPTNDKESNDPSLIQARLEKEYGERCIRNGAVSARRAVSASSSSIVAAEYDTPSQKFVARLNTSSLLLVHSRARNDKKGKQLWDYVQRVTTLLRHNGMSDEESDAEEVTTSGEIVYNEPVIKVLNLPWRHPHFRELYEGVDKVPGVKRLIFKQMGRNNALKRRRVDKDSTRSLIPKRLFPSFYRPDYLAHLLPSEVEKLKLTVGDFALRNFVIKFKENAP